MNPELYQRIMCGETDGCYPDDYAAREAQYTWSYDTNQTEYSPQEEYDQPYQPDENYDDYDDYEDNTDTSNKDSQ